MKTYNTKQIMKSLESHYLAGDYEKAKDLLLENKNSFNEGVFHYNLGTLNLKLNNPAAGRYHLEKALKKGHINSKTLSNLESAKKYLNVKDISSSKAWYDQGMSMALNTPGSLYLTATLILFVVFLFLLKIRALKSIFISIVFCLLIVSPISFYSFYLNKINFAINLKESPLHEGPSKIYSEITTIKAGSKFIVGEQNNDWLYIKYPLDFNGWIHKDDLALY